MTFVLQKREGLLKLHELANVPCLVKAQCLIEGERKYLDFLDVLSVTL